MQLLDEDKPARVRQEAAAAVLRAKRELMRARVAVIAYVVVLGAVAVAVIPGWR